MSDYDTIVVGSGIIGASTASHLTRLSSDDVLVLERAQPASRASGRAAGYVNPYQFIGSGVHETVNDYCIRFFEDLSERTDVLTLHRETAYNLARKAETLRNFESYHADTPVETELLDEEAVDDRLSSLITDGVLGALELDRGMHLDPYTATVAMLDEAKSRGARVEQAEVTALRRDSDGVTGVATDGESFDASNVVVAAGAWSDQLLDSVDISLPVKPRVSQLAILRPNSPLEMPLVVDSDLGVYYRSEGQEDVLIGFGGNEEVDPASFSTDASEEFLLEIAETAPQVAPELEDAELVNSWAGLCLATPDRQPLIGPIGEDGLYVNCGFNGEGIMHSPMAGRLLAEWITDADHTFDSERYDPGRFAGDEEFAIKHATELT